MAEFQINNEDLTSLKGKVVIITGMGDRHGKIIYTWHCCTENMRGGSY